MLKNLKIGLRLSIGLALIFLLLISLIVFGINRMRLLSEQTTLIYNHPLTVSNAVLRINANIIKIHRSMKDVALAQKSEHIEESSNIVNELEKEVIKDFEIISQRFLGEKEKYKAALEIFTAWKPIRDEVMTLMREDKRIEAANITKGKGARHVVKIEKAMEALGDFAQNKAKDFLHSTEIIRLNAFHMMYLLVACTVFLAILLAFFVTKSLTVPIEKLKSATVDIGKGKLDTVIEVKSKDEIGQLAESFNKMIEDLKSITASRDTLNKEIAERKRTEEEMQRQQYYLEKAQEIGSVGTWELDIVKNELIWTDQNYKNCGYIFFFIQSIVNLCNF